MMTLLALVRVTAVLQAMVDRQAPLCWAQVLAINLQLPRHTKQREAVIRMRRTSSELLNPMDCCTLSFTDVAKHWGVPSRAPSVTGWARTFCSQPGTFRHPTIYHVGVTQGNGKNFYLHSRIRWSLAPRPSWTGNALSSKRIYHSASRPDIRRDPHSTCCRLPARKPFAFEHLFVALDRPDAEAARCSEVNRAQLGFFSGLP